LHIGYIHKWSTIVYWGLKQINKMQYHNTLAISTYVCQLFHQFWGFHFDIWYIPKYWEIKKKKIFLKKKRIMFFKFNIFENNIISVQLTKVLEYPYCHMEMKTNAPRNTTTLIFFFSFLLFQYYYYYFLLPNPPPKHLFLVKNFTLLQIILGKYKYFVTRFLFLERKM